MPSATIMFGNQQATGDQPLAGAPEIAFNVVVDGVGAVRRRPGITTYDGFPGLAAYDDFSSITDLTTTMAVTGISAFNGVPVWVAGDYTGGSFPTQAWWTLDSSGALDAITGFFVQGAERPVFAITQFRLVVAANDISGAGGGSGILSTWTGSGFGSFIETGGQPSQVAALAQRLIVNDRTSSSTLNRIKYSGVGSTGNTTFGALSFVSAEANPDSVIALRENSNELFAFGGRTLQVFVPDPQIILAPQRTINRGCSAAHSVVRANEHFGWLDEERQIVVSDGRDIDEVSTPIAATLDDIATVDDCYGFRVNADQFDLMCWQFPTDGRTFAYQRGGGWSQWSTFSDTNEHGPFAITSHYYWPEQNLHLVGMEDGAIAQLSTSAYTDMGDPIKAEVTTGFYNHGTDAMKFTDALHITVKRGRATSSEPQVFLSWRDADGAPFNPSRRIGLGTTGDYVSTVTLRSLGGYRRRQWKLEFSDDTEFVLASVTEDFTVGVA